MNKENEVFRKFFYFVSFLGANIFVNRKKEKIYFSYFSATNGREMHRVINTHVEAIKIGRQIAEQALDSHRKTEDTGM